MQIHRFRGKTLHDALLRARDAHGEGAVVVSHEASPDGGVTVAVAEAPPVVRSRRRKAAAPVEPEAATGRALRVPERRPAEDPGRAEVLRRLEATGASSDLTTRVARAIAQSGAGGTHAIDVAAGFLGEQFKIAPSPRLAGGTHVITFVGPTGVGKSTTLVKLATKLVRAGRRVALASTDTQRPGGLAILREHAARLGTPLVEVFDARGLVRAVAEHRDAEVLLLDTAGRSPLDARSIDGLSRVLARTSDGHGLTTYLVLPATSQPEALDEAVRGFAPCRPDACVQTKLDETLQPTPALEFVRFHEMEVAFLCDGQDVESHLRRPRPPHFADLCLRGRLS